MCPGGLGSFGYGAYRSQRSSQDGLRGRALGFDSLGAPAAAACRGFRGALALGGLPKKGSCVARAEERAQLTHEVRSFPGPLLACCGLARLLGGSDALGAETAE